VLGEDGTEGYAYHESAHGSDAAAQETSTLWESEEFRFRLRSCYVVRANRGGVVVACSCSRGGALRKSIGLSEAAGHDSVRQTWV
jgi:hypothetical protein